MNNEDTYLAGYLAAKAETEDNVYSLDGKSEDFIAGFTQYFRDVDSAAGNPNTDKLDY